MRNIVLFTPALLLACATVPADPPVHGVTPGHKCEMEGTEQFIGQTRSDATGDAIKKVSHAAVLRWAPPGYAMTMDYREDRVTVYLDDAGKITKINCG
jgi:peptidase inhibitor I78 family protein